MGCNPTAETMTLEEEDWTVITQSFRVLGVRGNTASLIVLAEFGRYPLCFHWWQQILRYHNRINNLSDDERLIQCAFVEGMHDKAYRFWSHGVQKWLQTQSAALNIEDEICVSRKKKRKFTPLGVITGASRPRGSPGLLS